jgi:hypothetical protein
MILNVKPATKNDCAPIKVYCDMRSGGWTLIMRRFNGDENFFLNWNEYKTGFGNLSSEFWLGIYIKKIFMSKINKKQKFKKELFHFILLKEMRIFIY